MPSYSCIRGYILTKFIETRREYFFYLYDYPCVSRGVVYYIPMSLEGMPVSLEEMPVSNLTRSSSLNEIFEF